MAGVKIEKFLGIAPKISPELLPNTAGQVARGCKLYSGDLIPYPQPVVVANTQRTGEIKTIYALRNPQDDTDIKWLSWSTEVDIARLATDEDREQRFYFTGDGAPKVSNYELATTGAAPYPVTAYELGLPLPPDSAKLSATAGTFSTKTSSSFSRDAGNIARIVTSTAHGLRTGNIITVSGFSYRTGTYSQSGTTVTVTITGHGLSNGALVTLDFTSGDAVDGTFPISSVTANTFQVSVVNSATSSGNVRLDIRGFNATNIECTVINSTTIAYFSPGPQVSSTSSSDGKVDLGGLTQIRSYVFTWYTPWEEESIASTPSDNLFIKEGITTTVSNLPTVRPSGDNFIRGVRLYRTLPTASGTEYFLLKTLWFPGSVARVERTGNVSRVTMTDYHNLDIDDRFKISGCSVASFNITDGIVTDIIDEYTFEYAQTASNVADTAATGTLYHDAAESTDNAARYWGDGSYNFTDDFDSRTLLTILASDEFDPPPDNLQGLVVMQNEIYVGFVGNQIFFSEPGRPHAWPRKYIRSVEPDIVALAVIGGFLLVLTESFPYQVTGSDPNVMTVTRIDAQYPCVSKRSVVSMSYGILYSTHEGIALYSPTTGPVVITKVLFNRDTWGLELDPSTLVGVFYGDIYFASHSGGSIVFERDDRIGGFFIDCDCTFSAAYYDPLDGYIYFVRGDNGDIFRWDDLNQPSVTQEWKSKVIITKDYMNLGAARVVADYTNLTSVWDLTTTAWENTVQLWNNADQITFKLWVDKEEVFSTTLNSSDIFRLPSGFLSDTFEVGVEGNVRIRSIHLAETPTGLRTA
jgi:hypothetical protein